MNAITAPALRYHGGKFRLAPWVMRFFPAHQTYVEPYGGAPGVLIQKPPSYAEVYNDLDGDIVNFFRCLRDPALRERLIDALVLTPYSREEFDEAWNDGAIDPVDRARRTAIRAAMGFGSSGATKATTGFRVDCFRSGGTAQHVWAKYPAAAQAVGMRFAGVMVENRPALELIKQYDRPDTLFYIDPPYVHDTRKIGWSATYRHEMTDADHRALLDLVRSLQGYAVISGYASDLYVQSLEGWYSESTKSRISAGRGTLIRTETVWLNPRCEEAYRATSGLLPLVGGA